jgi:4-amino-4-deoxy-L-arabinose transferase-like glycosyltransferase
MPKKSTQKKKRVARPEPAGAKQEARQSRDPKLLFTLVVVLAVFGYFAAFLLQPSVLGLQDMDGVTINRLVELLLLPSLAGRVFEGAGSPGSLIDRLPYLLGAAGWLASAWWIGSPFASMDFLRGSNWLTRVSLVTLAGLAILSTMTFAVGVFQWFGTRWPLLAIWLLLMAFASWQRLRQRALLPNDETGEGSGEHEEFYSQAGAETVGQRWLQRWTQLIVLILVAFYLLSGVQPPWEFDVVEYHSQAVREFYEAGSIYVPSHNVYLAMPLGAEMHGLAIAVLLAGEDSWWSGAIVGKTIIAAYSLLAAGCLSGFLASRYGSQTGWMSAALLLSTAACVHVSTAGLIDMALGAYLVATCISMVLLWPRILKREGTWLQFCFIGLLAGGAGACKYPGLIYVVAPVALVLGVLIYRSARQLTFDFAGGFLLGLSLTCLPWLAKNLVETVNPVYPLAASIFDSYHSLDDEQLERWNRVHSPPSTEEVPAYSVAAALGSLKQLVVGSPFINPAVQFLALIGLLAVVVQTARGPERTPVWAITFAAFGFVVVVVWWFATHRIDRFWIPIVPLLVGLAVFGWQFLANKVSRGLASGIVFAGCVYGALQAISGAATNDVRVFKPMHEIRAEAGMREDISWLNQTLGKTARVLCVGEARAFLFAMPVDYATCFNTSLAEELLNESNEAALQRGLENFGATHVLVSWKEIERYRSPGNYGFSEWPERWQIDALVEANILEPVEIPFAPTELQLFRNPFVNWTPPELDRVKAVNLNGNEASR